MANLRFIFVVGNPPIILCRDSHTACEYFCECILRAAPTAAGPCSRDAWFLVILCLIPLLKCVLARLFLDVNFQVTFLTHNYHFGHGYGHFWSPKPVIWQAWCLHFGTLGDHGTIQGHLGAQERRPWGPGIDLC